MKKTEVKTQEEIFLSRLPIIHFSTSFFPHSQLLDPPNLQLPLDGIQADAKLILNSADEAAIHAALPLRSSPPNGPDGKPTGIRGREAYESMVRASVLAPLKKIEGECSGFRERLVGKKNSSSSSSSRSGSPSSGGNNYQMPGGFRGTAFSEKGRQLLGKPLATPKLAPLRKLSTGLVAPPHSRAERGTVSPAPSSMTGIIPGGNPASSSSSNIQSSSVGTLPPNSSIMSSTNPAPKKLKTMSHAVTLQVKKMELPPDEKSSPAETLTELNKFDITMCYHDVQSSEAPTQKTEALSDHAIVPSSGAGSAAFERRGALLHRFQTADEFVTLFVRERSSDPSKKPSSLRSYETCLSLSHVLATAGEFREGLVWLTLVPESGREKAWNKVVKEAGGDINEGGENCGDNESVPTEKGDDDNQSSPVPEVSRESMFRFALENGGNIAKGPRVRLQVAVQKRMALKTLSVRAPPIVGPMAAVMSTSASNSTGLLTPGVVGQQQNTSSSSSSTLLLLGGSTTPSNNLGVKQLLGAAPPSPLLQSPLLGVGSPALGGRGVGGGALQQGRAAGLGASTSGTSLNADVLAAMRTPTDEKAPVVPATQTKLMISGGGYAAIHGNREDLRQQMTQKKPVGFGFGGGGSALGGGGTTARDAEGTA